MSKKLPIEVLVVDNVEPMLVKQSYEQDLPQWRIMRRQNSKAKLKEMPLGGSCITYKILKNLISPRDSTYLLARLKYVTQQTYSSVISQMLQTYLVATINSWE